MKIIFLDIDGVVNVNYGERDDYGQIFHPEYVENLKWICEAIEILNSSLIDLYYGKK